ncbi:MAG: 3-hydroxyacyl-CoA dehydrogenase family protein [Desulfovibrio sp.]|nr:3-hydroxyacyl-CoA dehydrogenase family protein [Desulfovibrio sp.]
MHVQGIATVACLGTGTMGHGLAFLAARAGYAVRLFGRSEQSIQRGLAGVDRAIVLYEDSGLLAQGGGEALKGRITGHTRMEDALNGVDMVVEALAEDVEIKRAAFLTAEQCARSGALLATNTSGIRLSSLAAVLARPEYFLATHFFNPPHLMLPVEICPVPATLPSVLELGESWVRSLGRVPLRLNREVEGFIVNRLQCACLREALHIVESGWASAETVDAAVRYSLGRRYYSTGPLETADMGGLDIFCALMASVAPTLDAAAGPGTLLADSVARGDLGVKTGKGLYDWPPEVLAARRANREKSLIDFLRRDTQEISPATD